MNDPHVEWLVYRIETGPTVTFSNPPEVIWHTPECNIRLAEGTAWVEMIQHCATEAEARVVVEPHLRAYELSAALHRGGLPEVLFKFLRADIMDRNPPAPGGPRTMQALSGNILIASGEVTFHVTRCAYPPPPQRFVLTADVELLWSRNQDYRHGKERLTAMAYFALTVVEASVGPGDRRRRAAARYRVDLDVLRQLAFLTSEVGDAETARKWGRSVNRTHTGQERAWIEACVLKLMQRMAEYAADPSAPLTPITMSDLPVI